jgi:hypothetical protein
MGEAKAHLNLYPLNMMQRALRTFALPDYLPTYFNKT